MTNKLEDTVAEPQKATPQYPFDPTTVDGEPAYQGAYHGLDQQMAMAHNRPETVPEVEPAVEWGMREAAAYVEPEPGSPEDIAERHTGEPHRRLTWDETEEMLRRHHNQFPPQQPYTLVPGDPNFSYESRAFAEGRLPTHDEMMADARSGVRGRKIDRMIAQRLPNEPEGIRVMVAPNQVPVTPATGRALSDKAFEAVMAESLERVEAGAPDAGSKYREMIQAYQARKAAQRRKRIKFWTGWLVFLLLLVAVAFGVWKVLPDYLVKGRYTVTAECKAELGKTEITGKREYNYAYKSLFGYHLVDESSVLERTTIDVTGEKLTILGYNSAKGKTWRQNISAGERGIAILKPADLYWFLSDKDMATVPYSSFCK